VCLANAHAGLYLGPEGVGVALQDALHRRLPRRLVLVVVAAVDAVAAVAVPARREALAIPAGRQGRSQDGAAMRASLFLLALVTHPCKFARSVEQCQPWQAIGAISNLL